MVYRIAAEGGVLEDDKAFLADVRREVQRERDVRRLRRLATLLPYRGGEALPVVRKASDDDQFTAADALDSGGVGLLVGGWSLAAFFIVPAIVVLLVRATARAIAAVLRNRLERRLYGRAYHQKAASVMSLFFSAGALAASFAGDGYRETGWVVAGVGWFVSAVCASRRHEWITQYTPWLESEVEA